MKTNKLLIDESPLQVLPSLAKKIGLNQAIFLQQLHYWLGNRKIGKIVDGEKWIFNSVVDWKKDNFPFWSAKTIYRIVDKLIELEIIKRRSDLNKSQIDRTYWYTIDYTKLEEFSRSGQSVQMDNLSIPSGQSVQMQVDNLSKPIPETTTKTTTDIYDDDKKIKPLDHLVEVSLNPPTEFEQRIADPEDSQFWGYRDEALKAYQNAFGQSLRPASKDAIVELANGEGFDLDVWKAACKSAAMGGVRSGNVKAIIDTYKVGGNYADLFGNKNGTSDGIREGAPTLTSEQLEVYNRLQAEKAN